MKKNKKILITGASSGLGRQMAIEFAGRGYDLALAGRGIKKLKELKTAIQGSCSVTVGIFELDVTDFNKNRCVIFEAAEKLGSLDIVIAGAGISGVTKIGVSGFENTVSIINTNVIGAMATIDAAVALFRKQGHGHVVGISSVAGFRGFPKAGAYCASKAAMTVYLQALQAAVWGTEIKVTNLAPGYIDTPLNRGEPRRPFLISVEKGGVILANLIEKQVKFSTAPRFPWGIVRHILKILPTNILARLF